MTRALCKRVGTEMNVKKTCRAQARAPSNRSRAEPQGPLQEIELVRSFRYLGVDVRVVQRVDRKVARQRRTDFSARLVLVPVMPFSQRGALISDSAAALFAAAGLDPFQARFSIGDPREPHADGGSCTHGVSECQGDLR